MNEKVMIKKRRILFMADVWQFWGIAADPVQDLYLRELRSYKPTPPKPGDADAHVHKFNVPRAPPPPEEMNIASDLKAYEAQEVEVEGQAASGESAPVEESWFEDEEDEAPTAH
ncbi:ATP synthase complex subunit h domain containing protein [Elaphomyces granulatus]